MDLTLFCKSTILDPKRDWCMKTSQLNYMVMCYKQTFARKEGLWRAENAINVAAPAFISQLLIIVSINRLLIFAFRPLRLPRITAEILGGVILGAGGIGGTYFCRNFLFPYRSILTLETMANLGLLYYMFLLGLEIDLKPVLQAPQKAFTIALSGVLLTFPIGYALHHMLVKNFATVSNGLPNQYGPLFWGIALSATNFPDLAQILVDLKLFRSEVGRTALFAAIITDLSTWLLLILCMAIVNSGHVYTLVSSVTFVMLSTFALRPALAWVIGLTSERILDSCYDNYHIGFVLALAVAFGYVSDACGCHSILVGFMLGVIMPKGELKEKLIEKVEGFVLELTMPLFFMIIGFRTNHMEVFSGQVGIGRIFGVLGLTFVAKIASTFLDAVFFNKMKPGDGLALGLLMNTKGLLTLIIIGSARDIKVLDKQTFTALITALWLMTAAVEPILSLAYKSGKPSGECKRITLASLEPHGSEFRILACFHSSQEVIGIANLLDASSHTKDSPISFFALHLVEHVGRASTMLIVHDACKIDGVGNDDDKKQYESSAIVASATFNDLKTSKESGALFVQLLTAISSFATMHKDICSLAEEKQINLIVLPFHLKPTIDGGMGSTKGNPYCIINKHVLENSLFSVAVLVDRGHRPPTVIPKLDSRGRLCRHFFVIFIGGPDDREVLSYAKRMSKNPNIGLTVIQFSLDNENHVELSTNDEEKEEKLLDNRCLEEFSRETKNNSAVKLTEVAIRSGDEIVQVIQDMEGEEYDLIMVGRGKERALPIAAGSLEWSEFPELGPLGDTLVCSSFAANAWILVVKQGSGCGYIRGGGYDEGVTTLDQQEENKGSLSEIFARIRPSPDSNPLIFN